MCDMVDTYTLRSARVSCVAAIKAKNYREKCKRGYEGQIEGPYLGGKQQRKRGHSQINDQPHSQVGVEKAPNSTKEE